MVLCARGRRSRTRRSHLFLQSPALQFRDRQSARRPLKVGAPDARNGASRRPRGGLGRARAHRRPDRRSSRPPFDPVSDVCGRFRCLAGCVSSAADSALTGYDLAEGRGPPRGTQAVVDATRSEFGSRRFLSACQNAFTLLVTDGIGLARTAPVTRGSHFRSGGGAQAQQQAGVIGGCPDRACGDEQCASAESGRSGDLFDDGV
jgi:hypothetical protein